MIKYETNPSKIRKKSEKIIKDKLSFKHLTEQEQSVAIEMIQASGDLSLLENLRFSKTAIKSALIALADDYDLLCDTAIVASGVNTKYLKEEPICLITKANIISQAKAKKQTRSMLSVDLWKPYLNNSIILIGTESTALFRLLENLEKEENSNKKPALIIATPVGFTGAESAKNYLWENHEKLGIPCITLLGSRGSSNLTATAINTLLKLQYLEKN